MAPFIKAEHGRGIARPLDRPAKRPIAYSMERRFDGGPQARHVPIPRGLEKVLEGARRRIDPGFNRGGFAGFPHLPPIPRNHAPFDIDRVRNLAKPMHNVGQLFHQAFPGFEAPQIDGGFNHGYGMEGQGAPGAPTGFPGMGDLAHPYGAPGAGEEYGADAPGNGMIPFQPPSGPQHPMPGLGAGPTAGMNPAIMQLIQQMMAQRQPRPRWEGTMNPNFGRGVNIGRQMY